jgi:hypothetical protein
MSGIRAIQSEVQVPSVNAEPQLDLSEAHRFQYWFTHELARFTRVRILSPFGRSNTLT